MSYKAIRSFIDGENGRPWPKDQGGLRYDPGDTYPGEGFEPGEEHIAYLLGSGNKLKAPCIELVEEIPEGPVLSRMRKPELEELAKTMGLETEGKTVKELTALIQQAMAEEEEEDGNGGSNAPRSSQAPSGADKQQSGAG